MEVRLQGNRGGNNTTADSLIVIETETIAINSRVCFLSSRRKIADFYFRGNVFLWHCRICESVLRNRMIRRVLPRRITGFFHISPVSTLRIDNIITLTALEPSAFLPENARRSIPLDHDKGSGQSWWKGARHGLVQNAIEAQNHCDYYKASVKIENYSNNDQSQPQAACVSRPRYMGVSARSDDRPDGSLRIWCRLAAS